MLPTVQGTIDRRILVNYRVDPQAVAKLLPAPFRPKLTGRLAMAGICLIRLKALRPRFLPAALGLRSENAAHRFAVEWDADGQIREGVFIPRRDSSSRLNTILGGRLFPGFHHHARFRCEESNENYRIQVDSDDRHTHLDIAAKVTEIWPRGSIFESLAAASDFFRGGSLGYSISSKSGSYDGLELECQSWSMQALEVSHVESSYFDDVALFPPGSAQFDSALLMRNVPHFWHERTQLTTGRGLECCPSTAV